jgi:hypothetical protein
VVLDRSAAGQEDHIHQRLSESDFRLFPAENFVILQDRLDPTSIREKQEGEWPKSDLVFHVQDLTAREGAAEGRLLVFHGGATVQVFNAFNGELMTTHTASEVAGQRHTVAEVAKRSATEKAIDQALDRVVKTCLARVGRLMVHEAVFTGVKDEVMLREIVAKAGALDGIKYVRRLQFDSKSGRARIEIVGSPKTDAAWRAFIESVPGMLGKDGGGGFRFIENKKLREQYPDWFKQ